MYILTRSEREQHYSQISNAVQDAIDNLSEEMIDITCRITELDETKADIEVQMMLEEVNGPDIGDVMIVHSAWIKAHSC